VTVENGAISRYIGIMSAIPFDTLKLARSLRDKAKFGAEQAEGVADALSEAFQGEIATKTDLRELEHRLTIKIGSRLVVAVGILTALIKLA
jgi:hypothetical protein